MASELKSMAGSTDLNCGKRNGEQIEMEDGPLSKESGSHKQPGFPTRSTKYSLQHKKNGFIRQLQTVQNTCNTYVAH